uniref:Uncharacterized protein n=1 Tax=Mycena chlorophos TaxID=658473 RepID=A0ABQ0LKJ3_MYCCL|nr:predicted protein [Mycena chlorophos]
MSSSASSGHRRAVMLRTPLSLTALGFPISPALTAPPRLALRLPSTIRRARFRTGAPRDLFCKIRLAATLKS